MDTFLYLVRNNRHTLNPEKKAFLFFFSIILGICLISYILIIFDPNNLMHKILTQPFILF